LPHAISVPAPLRVELDLQFTGEVLLGEQLVLADIGRDHLPDLLRLDQDAEANAVDPRTVGHHGEIADPRLADGQNQALRNAAQPEPAGHDQHAIVEQPRKDRWRVGVNLVHVRGAKVVARSRPRGEAARSKPEKTQLFATAMQIDV
jgi:hypothetical protein